MQEGDSFYFKGSKGKGIEVPIHEELLELIYRILKLDLTIVLF